MKTKQFHVDQQLLVDEIFLVINGVEKKSLRLTSDVDVDLIVN